MTLLPFSNLFLDAIPSITSCEYWKGVLQNGWGCTLGSFAAIAASYGIYQIANRNARRDKEQEAKDILLYFKGTVANVINISKQQVQNLETYYKQIEIKDLNLPLLSFLPLYNLKRIAEGDSMDRILIAYIRQFPGKSSVKEFGKLISGVEYLYGQFLLLPEEMRLTLNYDHERKTEYQRLFKDSFALLGEYMLRQNPAVPTPAAQEIEGVMNEFAAHHNDNYDIEFYHRYFFEPLNDALVAIMSGIEVNQIFIQLAQMTRNGKQQFNFIKSENRHSAENIKVLMPGLKTAISELENNATKILAFD
jgi:hypothetical protein